MTKQELIKRIADRVCIPQTDVKAVLDVLAEEVGNELREQGKSEIHGIANLAIKQRAARSGRNPRTGEQVDIPARRAIALKPASALKALAAA